VRRVIILILLLGLMQLIALAAPFGGAGRAILVFGFLILAAYSAGELAENFHLPKIVGYLVAGLLFGPHATSVVRPSEALDLQPVGDLAIALIAFIAGAELDMGDLRRRGVSLLKVTSTELTVSFVAIFAALVLMRPWIPFLAGYNWIVVCAFAGLFASVAIVHSPAVTIALLTETRAQGPVAKTTLGVVLIADVAVVLLFSVALSVARALVPSGAKGVGSLGATVWEIGGAFPVGLLIGIAIVIYLRLTTSDLFLFAILATFFGLEVARLMHTEPLLTLLVAGFIARNFSRHGSGVLLREAMERSAAPVFVIFFALAGAKIELPDLARLWPLVLPIALVRAGAIRFGTRMGARWARLPASEARPLWMGLISQAGVAIGLVTVASASYPAAGGEMRTLLLTLIAMNETVGAILFRRALQKAGEVGGEGVGIEMMESQVAGRTSQTV
jgi:Kef-type K+ transport system membrane component KefB